MVDRLIEASLRKRAVALFGVLLLVGFGVWAVMRIPIDAFPDVTNIQVEVVSTSPGLSPPEVERFVTFPVETAMRGLPRLDQVRSVSKAGLSVVTVVFEDGADIYFARQLVLERLIEARERVPEGTAISMGPVSTAMGEIYQYTLAGERPAGMSEIEFLTQVRTAQDWILSPLLKAVPGVNEVNSFGGYIRQFHVTADPDRLAAYDLTLGDIGEALRRNNLNVGGNILERGERQYLVRGVGLLQTADDIGAVALKTERGTPVLVRDVAVVEAGQAVRQGGAVKDGRGEVVGGVAMMLRGANGRQVVRAVQARVAEVNASGVLPFGLRVEPFYQRSDIIGRAIHTVTEALLIGSLLVVVILLVFLRSFRGAFIVLLALPLSVLFTFVMMRASGLSANLMSLGGLAISIGMIIDATIIQVENVQRHLSERGAGARRFETVLAAILEVRKPSIFGELIIALTFIPILSLQGMEGKMFMPLAFTHIIALLASLLLSLAAIPAFCHFLLKPQGDKTSFLVEGARKAYLPVLRWGLRRKAVVVLAALALLAGTAALIPRLGTEFMPIMDEGALDTDIQFLPGISLAESLEMSRKVEARLMEFPELVTVVGKTGQTGVALEARGVEKTGYVGVLKPRGEWTSARTREELTDKMREAMEDFPGMAFSFSQPIACRIDELVAGTRAQVIVKLFGEDLDVLKAKADEIAAVLARIGGATDINVERVAGQPYITVRPDRARIARLGLAVEDVQSVVEAAVGGKTVTQIYEGDRYFDLQVRYPEERRNSVETIGAILVRTPGGARVPLGQVAEIAMLEGPSQISRESGQRRIGVECNISGRDLGGFVAEARRAIARDIALAPGYFVTWGGQFENQQRAMQRLAVILPVTIGLVLALLFLTFGSLRTSLLVLLDLPFALVGGVLALWLSGLYLSVPASVGFIALFGIAVLNGIVLLSYITQLEERGRPAGEAIVEGCLNRLRPVLMTATITVLSLVPLLFARGPGSEIQRPLAVVVVGGLISSTLLTLLVLPVLYSWLGKKKGSNL
ncbi:MAG TPA: CusA/CzcA family heavy metal efflux RND transporter [Candidatus Aminicenantes bacterium]|nr:CusA/CzcA family heavy metal efflux RND transporter [Candidatus Aminicenantes bacterium]